MVKLNEEFFRTLRAFVLQQQDLRVSQHGIRQREFRLRTIVHPAPNKRGPANLCNDPLDRSALLKLDEKLADLPGSLW